MNQDGGLSDLERKIVDLADEGYTRWKISEILGVGETTVRRVIRNLCEWYDCSLRDLPERVRMEEEKGES